MSSFSDPLFSWVVTYWLIFFAKLHGQLFLLKADFLWALCALPALFIITVVMHFQGACHTQVCQNTGGLPAKSGHRMIGVSGLILKRVAADPIPVISGIVRSVVTGSFYRA